VSNSGRVLLVAIDASTSAIIERGMADGSLPNLARLRERGVYGPLGSTAEWLAGTPWPSFYTGSLPPEHGFLFHLQWRPDLMRHDRPSPQWLPLHPFYRGFGHYRRRVVAIDVPITYGIQPDEAFDGVEITGWSSHDKIAPTSAFPAGTFRSMTRRYGRQPIILDIPVAQSVGALLKLKDGLIRSVAKQTALCESLMTTEAWDCLLLGIGAVHRGGHKLWDRTSILGSASPNDLAAYDRALHEVYLACDEAVGRLVKLAGTGSTVIVASLHGMQENHSRFDLLPLMLERILSDGRTAASRTRAQHRVLGGLRTLVPIQLRTEIKSRLPESIQDGLSRFWRPHDRKDWARTSAFCVMGDLQGMIQINLKGRERNGIVEPGAEYQQRLDQIAQGLMTWVDYDTGEPLVRRLARGNELYPEVTDRKIQPDLIVDWVRTPAARHRAITSTTYGTIDWPLPGKPLDGRSGHHTELGWLLAVGEGVRPGTTLQGAHGLDLNATIHALLGLPRPGGMRGEPLPELLGTSRPKSPQQPA